jgi:hypothetical protein
MRIAVYFTPPSEHPLARFAAAWFAREDLKQATAPAAFYGFHATLKPPFLPRLSRSLQDILLAAQSFAEAHPALTVGQLRVEPLGSFLALLPGSANPELDAFAAACVRDFDRFRAAPEPQELTRRRAKGLNARQEHFLSRWGYPYVMEEFRFHMTLTGPLDPVDLADASSRARQMLGNALLEPLVLDAVTLSLQTARDRGFLEWRRLPLRG